jgi:hypothetical protein
MGRSTVLDVKCMIVYSMISAYNGAGLNGPCYWVHASNIGISMVHDVECKISAYNGGGLYGPCY